MSRIPVAIIGAGPYGLSLAAHLGERNIEHRIFGRPMRFWSQVAEAANERYLKSFCFATNLSTPKPGFTLSDYNKPRGLETFEPCSMGNFAEYGQWFQHHNVPWAEPVDVTNVERQADEFLITLASGERLTAANVVVATGLAHFASVPTVIASLAAPLCIHTSRITNFTSFKGKSVAVVGAGQSALEAVALLNEAGAKPELLVRETEVLWHKRVSQDRTLWQRVRSPISGLGVGPKAWALISFPGALQRMPADLRTRLTKNHLPPEGAWWLRERVENKLPIHLGATVEKAREEGGRVALQLTMGRDGQKRDMTFDHVIAGSGYDINVERLQFVDANLRSAVECLDRSPILNSAFESSVRGLHFVGPTSAKSFGPLFRFVIGADYTARVVSSQLALQVAAKQDAKVSFAA